MDSQISEPFDPLTKTGGQDQKRKNMYEMSTL